MTPILNEKCCRRKYFPNLLVKSAIPGIHRACCGIERHLNIIWTIKKHYANDFEIETWHQVSLGRSSAPSWSCVANFSAKCSGPDKQIPVDLLISPSDLGGLVFLRCLDDRSISDQKIGLSVLNYMKFKWSKMIQDGLGWCQVAKFAADACCATWWPNRQIRGRPYIT